MGAKHTRPLLPHLEESNARILHKPVKAIFVAPKFRKICGKIISGMTMILSHSISSGYNDSSKMKLRKGILSDWLQREYQWLLYYEYPGLTVFLSFFNGLMRRECPYTNKNGHKCTGKPALRRFAQVCVSIFYLLNCILNSRRCLLMGICILLAVRRGNQPMQNIATLFSGYPHWSMRIA